MGMDRTAILSGGGRGVRRGGERALPWAWRGRPTPRVRTAAALAGRPPHAAARRRACPPSAVGGRAGATRVARPRDGRGAPPRRWPPPGGTRTRRPCARVDVRRASAARAGRGGAAAARRPCARPRAVPPPTAVDCSRRRRRLGSDAPRRYTVRRRVASRAWGVGGPSGRRRWKNKTGRPRRPPRRGRRAVGGGRRAGGGRATCPQPPPRAQACTPPFPLSHARASARVRSPPRPVPTVGPADPPRARRAQPPPSSPHRFPRHHRRA